jgi:hypothetical protein
MAVAGKPQSWHESQRYKGKPQKKQIQEKHTPTHGGQKYAPVP